MVGVVELVVNGCGVRECWSTYSDFGLEPHCFLIFFSEGEVISWPCLKSNFGFIKST